MKGGNLSQLNDYAMTHPACGECKHCEMQEKDQYKLYLSAIFQLGLQIRQFLQVTHGCSTVYCDGYDTALTALCCRCRRMSAIPGILNLFPTQE